MRSGSLWKFLVVAPIVGVVASGGCGTSDGSKVGSGGVSGSGGTGGSASGGSGSGGSLGSGGTTSTGGNSATGGATASGGMTASGGVAATGGHSSQAGGTGAPLASGGQAGFAIGGSSSTGGVNGAGGSGGVAASGGAAGSAAPGGSTGRSISFGTLLDAQAVMAAARQLAKTVAVPGASQWQAKGDQHRKYRFADANADEPYRLYVPTNWDGKTSLPLAMFLHGSGSDENSYVDQNNKQLITLAQQHGYLLVAPLGAQGAYGNFLRLSSPFGKPDEAAKLMAAVTTATERTNELSEQDVINVLELVLAEYPIDRTSMFLFGHSMGSGGTWYLGGKYAEYWKGLAPMSCPFVQETVYPWDDLRNTPIFVTEGTQAPSVDGSHVLRDWLKSNGFKSEYKEVNADHGGMIPLVLPDVFDFFDRSRTK